mmetsp:Transcript_10437/g.18398  ORF Transcript_10437/g.18398 Transcript_10437/m.18398 type:complete len:245 (-) Transcript_10437:1326-2060(-)
MPTNIYVKARGTIPPVDPLVEIEDDMTISDLKCVIKKKLTRHKAGTLPCPLMAALPVESIVIYVYNRSSDDYLTQKDGRRVLDNPLPEHFAEAPGTTPETPLFFDYDLPEDWPPVEVLTDPKLTPCNTMPALPPGLEKDDGGSIKFFCKARGTIPQVDPCFYIKEHYTISDLQSLIKQMLVRTNTDLAAVQEEDIAIYLYNKISDDYLVQVRDRRLLENPLPEHFALPPGCDMEHPLFFDYTLP